MRRDHYVTLVTPEVTIEDLALNPSVANPRPTQGPPVYRDVRGKDAVLYHGPADIVVYAGDMPTDRATSKLEPNDILRRYIGTYEIGDPRIGPAEHCESLDERFQDAYADVVNHRWIDMPEADLTTAHRDAVASVLGALGYTPEILRLNIDKPVIKLQTANDLFPAYVDLMIQLSRTNPKLAANLFDFATGDSPAARQAEADAGLPPNENLNAFVHPTSNETLRRAFRDPEGPEVEQHFGKLNFHTVILGRALFDQANDALGQQLPQHPQLHQHLDGRVRAPLSLDEARTTLLEFVGQPFPSGMLVEVPTLTERPSHALPTDPAPPPLVQVPRESTRPALSATPEIVNPTPETRPPAAPGHYPFPGG
jgi:hypothetical protein